jgi:hypothetical protein
LGEATLPMIKCCLMAGDRRVPGVSVNGLHLKG